MFSRNTALMIIDMQKDGVKIVPAMTSVIPVIKTVLNACRSRHLPVIHKIRVHRASGIDVENFRTELFRANPFLVEGTQGAEIVDELKPLECETIVKGIRFSAFFQTDLQAILARLGIKTLVISGVQTPNCIRATVTDAIAYDYNVVLLKDSITAQSPEVHEANLFDMKNMGVKIITASEFVEQL